MLKILEQTNKDILRYKAVSAKETRHETSHRAAIARIVRRVEYYERRVTEVGRERRLTEPFTSAMELATGGWEKARWWQGQKLSAETRSTECDFFGSAVNKEGLDFECIAILEFEICNVLGFKYRRGQFLFNFHRALLSCAQSVSWSYTRQKGAEHHSGSFRCARFLGRHGCILQSIFV